MLVHFDIDGNGVKEWTLVELQGRVENREEGDTIDGLPLGQLTRTDGGEIELVVGNSKLVGAEVKLDKPFAVLVPNQDKQVSLMHVGCVCACLTRCRVECCARK
eukprot:TRINITY_DN862_c0_g1_i2.p2 TRINITY_DN862_c0_g1~~TRINITY_DN862_c0_g1_i2.p2  ORF type:complete len:104 (-),score=8.75 TRINITY_DN862_c0_g1_i2:124-435(-)